MKLMALTGTIAQIEGAYNTLSEDKSVIVKFAQTHVIQGAVHQPQQFSIFIYYEDAR